MDEKKQTALRIFGVLLLVLIFTLQAEASFPTKEKTDLAPALEQARSEMKQVMAQYQHEHTFDLEEEVASNEATSDQTKVPNQSLMASSRAP